MPFEKPNFGLFQKVDLKLAWKFGLFFGGQFCWRLPTVIKEKIVFTGWFDPVLTHQS
jgi:hypothetical protein